MAPLNENRHERDDGKFNNTETFEGHDGNGHDRASLLFYWHKPNTPPIGIVYEKNLGQVSST